jgi:hypothetical protein
MKTRIKLAIYVLRKGTLPKWWWEILSDKFYEDKVAHEYKDGKFDYRFIRKWFLSQTK